MSQPAPRDRPRTATRAHPTVGVLSTWSVYEGATIDGYTHTLLQGICAAARDEACSLLIGCGMSLPSSPRASRTAWAVPGAGVDFVPVGPWNADGLIIIPDDLSESQLEYVQALIRSGYPIILTTAEVPGPLVAVDNAGGIRQAFNHLLQHGHRQVAFIAGKSGHGGDTAERLAAYRAALRKAGLAEDPRLIAFGEHRREDGCLAMRQILASGAPFTAVLASNDLSCLGAIEALREAGRAVPDDVAVIGFDDILDARSHLPPLTTVRHPTFALGYQAVLSLLAAVAGRPTPALAPAPTAGPPPERAGTGVTGEGASVEPRTRVPTQMVVRQSCGCRPEGTLEAPLPWLPPLPSDPALTQMHLAGLMAAATLVEARHSPRAEIETLCARLVAAFAASLASHEAAAFDAEIRRLADWLESRGEEAHAWQAAFSVLRRGAAGLLSPLAPPADAALTTADLALAGALIDRARLEISEKAQRQANEALLGHMAMANRLGLMTAQLLAALDAAETTRILAQHLPPLGIEHVFVALYAAPEHEEDDGLPDCGALLDEGLPESAAGRQFAAQSFPPPGLYPAGQPVRLAILPLALDEHTSGFVAFSATNLEPCAAIVHNLAAALRTNRLYRDALEGRRMAEAANRLKSRFLSTVSHELRTPLSLIVGLSDMVLQEQREAASLSGRALRDVEQIYASAQHLGMLIGDVLDLASSEAGQLRLLREPLDLAEALGSVAQIGEQLAREKGLAWQADIPPHAPRVFGDRTRLRQVALNLVSNAVKFTAAGTVAFQIVVSEQAATVRVSDTGIGVPAADQTSIFREFYRSERTVQSGYGGLGLGLAICKQLVEQHGGTIGLRSPGDLQSPGDPGSGSTFFFSLPLLPGDVQAAGQGLPLEPGAGRVMVVTVRAETGERLLAYLRERGFEASWLSADQGLEALSELLAAPPEALILDQETAARHGWALLDQLKRQPPAVHFPVLVYALDLEHDRGEWLELNYLTKPIVPEQLAAELGRYGAARARQVVLVVDDDPSILDFHCRLVEQMGCRALRARGGREALAALERGGREHSLPDLILLDLMMPEMDGFAVLDELRAHPSTRDIPVVILTARALDEADIERVNRRVAAVLSKGLFSATETLNHIEAALMRRQGLGDATQRLVRRAMGFVHEHYAQPLTREQIASHVNISPDYLTHCFRQELGITPMTYLTRFRLQRAQALLDDHELSITEIALSTGFSEVSHFSRTFERQFGVSPRAYRRRQR